MRPRFLHCSSLRPLPPLQKSFPLIARAPRNIRRVNAVFPCWSYKTAEQFLSIMPMAAPLAESGRSSVEQKASGGSLRSPPRAMDCSNLTIMFRIRSRNGRATRANRRSPSGNCSTRPTGLKVLHVFNARRSAIAMPWQFDYRLLPNLERLSFMARAICKSFPNYCAENYEGAIVISYFEGHVSNRLGLGRLNYKKDARDNPLPATGFELTAREWARLGELVLGHGSYHGRQIVPAAFLREAFTGSQANPSYGLTFWLNEQASHGREADMERMLDLPWQNAHWSDVCICRDAPADMVVALGSGYQRLFVIPSLEAIIVRQGSNAKFSDAHFLRLILGL